ncbi:T9SS type A sorting domain-containing protein [Maribacter sp. 2-571]|uniref:T9SS type A sorting domain-containing protein n=1 Tax=Maribacter sp. 2-571 TaxID=3417569 RepID=UPI003D354BB1
MDLNTITATIFKKNTITLLIVNTFLFAPESTNAQRNYIPGKEYSDDTGYVSYHAGNLPIILSAPHGGRLRPRGLPDRNCDGCKYVNDAYSRTITLAIYDEFVKRTGMYPHMITNKLHRSKFDANREKRDAADGNKRVEQAWFGYHDFTNEAKDEMVLRFGKGLFLDMHGHAHSIQRIEFAYALTAQELRRSNARLNENAIVAKSSIRSLAGRNRRGYAHSELIRGEKSLGTLLSNSGFPSVPSSNDPAPSVGEPYFNGGYNTRRHGSGTNNRAIDAIQVELNQGIRFNENARKAFVTSFTTSLISYIDHHYGNVFPRSVVNLKTDISETDSLYATATSKASLYPQPAEDYFNIRSDEKEMDVRVFDVLGNVVHEANWSGADVAVDFLSSGLYLVQLKKGETLIGTVKLLKY